MQAKPPNAEPPKRKRRWFRFSLRTLMIGVTLLAVACGYVGWQKKIIRERRRANTTHRTRSFLDIPTAADNWLHHYQEFRPRAPWPLRWLGEDGFAIIYAKDGETDDEIANLKQLFPEAEIWREDDPQPPASIRPATKS